MVAAGAFTEHDRVELIEGWVVAQMAKGPGHEYAVAEAEAQLRTRLPEGWYVRNQAPLTLDASEPEPDLTITRGSRAAYRTRHPGPDEVAAVVEVSDTTLETDRLKARTYGANGIATYWLINLAGRCVEVHTGPNPAAPTGYDDRRVAPEDGAIELRIGQAERSRPSSSGACSREAVAPRLWASRHPGLRASGGHAVAPHGPPAHHPGDGPIQGLSGAEARATDRHAFCRQ